MVYQFVTRQSAEEGSKLALEHVVVEKMKAGLESRSEPPPS